MNQPLPPALQRLIEIAAAREPLSVNTPADQLTVDASAMGGRSLYAHQNEKLQIDFKVERLAFADIQTMDVRLLEIAPASRNERHRHAHESIFVVLAGEGEVGIGDQWHPVQPGSVSFVPRWIVHQTRNSSASDKLVILAITDFGFTSALLGDYDQRTRLAQGGADSQPE